MIAAHYPGSMISYDHIQLADGEVLPCPDAGVNAKVYGVFVYSGTSTVIATEGDNLGQTWGATGAFRANTIDCGVSVQAAGETSWLCVSQNDDVRRQVLEQVVTGAFTLPASWGFLVLQGAVQVEGKLASQFQFFRPRGVDLEVKGAAVLLLVNSSN